MQNLMICDDNVNYIKDIINSISSNNISNLKLYNLSTQIDNSVYEIITRKEVDIIVINIEKFGLEIVKHFYENNIEIYKKSIILLYNNLELVKDIYNPKYNKYIYKCIKLSSFEKLIYLLHSITDDKEDCTDDCIINNKIERELRKLNFNFSLKGTRYLIESINIIYKNDLYNFNLTKDVFSVLSKKYCKSINTIKCDITQANNNMCEKCDKWMMMSYFGYFEDYYTPGPKDVMTKVFENI